MSSVASAVRSRPPGSAWALPRRGGAPQGRAIGTNTAARSLHGSLASAAHERRAAMALFSPLSGRPISPARTPQSSGPPVRDLATISFLHPLPAALQSLCLSLVLTAQLLIHAQSLPRGVWSPSLYVFHQHLVLQIPRCLSSFPRLTSEQGAIRPSCTSHSEAVASILAP